MPPCGRCRYGPYRKQPAGSERRTVTEPSGRLSRPRPFRAGADRSRCDGPSICPARPAAGKPGPQAAPDRQPSIQPLAAFRTLPDCAKRDGSVGLKQDRAARTGFRRTPRTAALSAGYGADARPAPSVDAGRASVNVARRPQAERCARRPWRSRRRIARLRSSALGDIDDAPWPSSSPVSPARCSARHARTRPCRRRRAR